MSYLSKSSNSPPNRRAGSRVLLLYGIIITAFINILHLGLPIYSMQVFNRVLPSGSLGTLLLLSVILLALIACSAVLEGARSILLSRIAIRSDVSFHDRGVHLALEGSKVAHDYFRSLDRLRSLHLSSTPAACYDAPWSLAFIIALYIVHPILGHLTLALMVTVLSCGFLGPLLSERYRSAAAVASSKIAAQLESARTQRDAMSAMGLRFQARERIRQQHYKYLAGAAEAFERSSWIEAGSRGIRAAAQVALLSVAATLVVTDEMAVGGIVAASMLFARAIAPFERLGGALHKILEGRQARRLLAGLNADMLDVGPKTRLAPLAAALSGDRLIVMGVGRARPILGPISFTLKAGELLTIVGAQGAGKSTLAKVIAGALKPTSGSFRIQGTELKHFDEAELGQQVGFLPEDIQLGDDSVACIISRGAPERRQEIVEAAELAGVHDVIQKLPDGYETVVSPPYSSLSAGERRQIGLARAFFGSPSLIVLDEPTAHLDDRSESQVINAVKVLKSRGSTVVIVSRFAALLNITDQVLLLDHGVIKLWKDGSSLSNALRPKLAAVAASTASAVIHDQNRLPASLTQ